MAIDNYKRFLAAAMETASTGCSYISIDGVSFTLNQNDLKDTRECLEFAKKIFDSIFPVILRSVIKSLETKKDLNENLSELLLEAVRKSLIEFVVKKNKIIKDLDHRNSKNVQDTCNMRMSIKNYEKEIRDLRKEIFKLKTELAEVMKPMRRIIRRKKD